MILLILIRSKNFQRIVYFCCQSGTDKSHRAGALVTTLPSHGMEAALPINLPRKIIASHHFLHYAYNIMTFQSVLELSSFAHARELRIVTLII
jgi:hypothetical protein